MSWQILAWASKQKTGSPTRKAVLLALANRANHDTGKCNPHVQRICEDTEFSDRAVRQAIEDLCTLKLRDGKPLIARERARRSDGSWTGYYYVFPADASGYELAGAATPPAGDAGDPPAGDAGQELGSKPLNQTTATTNGRVPATVGSKPVTAAEEQLASEVMAHFNEVFGASFSARTHYVGIIERKRHDKPEWTVAEFKVAVDRLAGQSWWKKDRQTGKKMNASPRHVFGSGPALDSVMNQPLDAEQPELEDLSVYDAGTIKV